MKKIKHNGFTLPNVGACVQGVKEEDKQEFLRLIQKAYGKEIRVNGIGLKDFSDAKYIGVPLIATEFNWYYYSDDAKNVFSILPISEAITWLKIGVGEITKENWVVDIVKEKDHLRIEEFKEWYQNSNIKFKYNWVANYYGRKNGICIDTLFPENYNIPIITLDQFFAYFYEEQESTDRQLVKGDLVEVSDDGFNWAVSCKRVYTGWITKENKFVTETEDGFIGLYKHIRLPKPQPTPRELAEKKAREFLESRNFPLSGLTEDMLTEYILSQQQ